jgi:ATP adenylyltransferase
MTERPLWAPWRIQYITGKTGSESTECVFCAAARGDAAESYERPLERGQGCFSLLNTFPYASGHLMVAPYRHVGELEELDDQELSELMQLARRGVAAQRKAMSPEGFNVGLNLGAVAGAGIADHLHLHVVPRWEGDNSFMPVLADVRVLPEALEATYDVLTEALKELD